MTKSTILKRLDGLVPDVDTIAVAYGVDQKRAKTILGNIAVFLQADEASVEYILSQVFVPVFAAAFGRLLVKRQEQLFTSLREAINDLQKMDGMLV